MNQRIKNLLSFLLRVLLSVGLLAYLFHKIDIAKMLETVRQADMRFVFFVIPFYIFIHFILLARWVVLVKALELRVPFKSLVSCFFIGLFFNLFLPTSTGGDIVKTLILFKDTDEKAKVVASVVADRLVGFVSISFVAFVAFVFGRGLLEDHSLFVMTMILCFLSVGIFLVLLNEKLYSFFCGIFRRAPRIQEKFMNFHYAMALFNKKMVFLFSAVVMSCVSQGILAVVFYLLSKALHQNVAFGYFLIFVPLICVVSSLPSIGGLGVRDAGAAYLFSKVGMSTAAAVSMSLISFFFMVMMGLVGGVFYVFTLSGGWIQRGQTDPGVLNQKT